MEKNDEKWWVFLGVKIPKILDEAMEEYIRRDTHATKSEFVRNAIREKLQRDAPWIISKILAEPQE